MHFMVYGKTIKIVEVVPSCHIFWNILKYRHVHAVYFGCCDNSLQNLKNTWVYTIEMVMPRQRGFEKW